MKVHQPYWLSAARPKLPVFPGGRVRADVAVIGGGLTGLSAAYHLLKRRPALRVVVLEAAALAAGASGRSTGMLGPGVGQSLGALSKRFGPAAACALYQATLRAVAYVESLITALGIDCELQMGGQLIVARSAGGRRRLRAQAELMQRLALPVEILDDATLARTLRLRPLIAEAASFIAGPAALRLPLAGTLHPVKLAAGLAERVLARGGILYEQARVTGWQLRPGGAVALQVAGSSSADAGEVLAEQVVVATAGYTPTLGLFGGRILPVHLQALVTEPLDDQALSAIGWTGGEGVLDARRLFSYCRLTADKRIVFGGGAPRYYFGGPAAAPAAGALWALSRLSAELHRTFPDAARLVVASGWTGVIGYVIDALPAIGRLPQCPQVVHAVGWCGHGVALGTAAGEWIAELVCSASPQKGVPALPWFRAAVPKVPTELLRFAGFRASVKWMEMLDRWA